MAGGAGGGGCGRDAGAGVGGSGAPRAPGGATPARPWADGLPPELLEAVARAVPAGDRLCFRLVCRRWAAAGKAVAPGAGEEQLSPGKVTRTSLVDMAASVARVEMMLGVLESSPGLIKGDNKLTTEAFAKSLCRFSAAGGHLAVLKWARAHRYPWGEITCAVAAKNGHLEVLPCARANGCPWDERTCAWAALNGHLEILQWARAHGCPWDKWIRVLEF